MDPVEKLRILSNQLDVECAEDKEISNRPGVAQEDIYISHAIMPNGKTLKLLKTVITSVCERNCYYCGFHAGRDFRRTSFQTDELARVFISLHQAGITQGIFISSGIVKGGIHTQDRIIDVAEILRKKYSYRGYIHLKIMPGAEFDQILRGMQLANRVSINLEAPNSERLNLIAPRKSYFEELFTPIHHINKIHQSYDPYEGWDHHWPSSSTQFVVGAAGESDWELLSTTHLLYKQLNMQRAYFSKFKPIPNTPLADKPATPSLRELRLYQASFLLRDYGFTLKDIPTDDDGNLPQHSDPKLVWANTNLINAPIEINKAGLSDLMRIPGIGPKNARLIIANRRIHSFTSLEQLGKLGMATQKFAPYIILEGKRPPLQSSFYFL